MRLLPTYHFLTLVLAGLCLFFTHISHAAPENSIRPDPIETKPVSSPSKNVNNPSMDSMQITPPPDKDYRYTIKPNENWYADRTWNFSLGYAWGVFDVDEKFDNTWVAGIHRTNYNSEDTAQEYGLEITRLNLIGVHGGYKWLCCFASYYEPFYKVSLAAYYDPADALANFINFERYLIRGSVGFENLFRLRRKLRFEMSAGVGPQGLTMMTNFIYAIPD